MRFCRSRANAAGSPRHRSRRMRVLSGMTHARCAAASATTAGSCLRRAQRRRCGVSPIGVLSCATDHQRRALNLLLIVVEDLWRTTASRTRRSRLTHQPRIRAIRRRSATVKAVAKTVPVGIRSGRGAAQIPEIKVDRESPRNGRTYAVSSAVQNTKTVAVVFGIILTSLTVVWAADQRADTSGDAAAIKQFNAAIASYMTLRRNLRSEVRGPVKNSSSTEMTDATDALAGAIQRSRREAKVGSIFAEPVASVIKRRIADAVRDEKLVAVLADIDDEGTGGPAPKVHLRLPVTAQMATMPAALLAVLPTLPKELEYRILGNYLILRDVDASLILDYVPAAVPR